MIDEYGLNFWLDYLTFLTKVYANPTDRIKDYFFTHVSYNSIKQLKQIETKIIRKRFLLKHR